VDLRRLRYFVAVAEEQHFGRAAARLHISTPPLSQRIREFERELGFPLFERTSRRVELTEAGSRLLDEARAVLAAADRFETVAASLTSPPPVLRIGYCNGSERLTLEAATTFRSRRPNVSVRPAALTSLRTFDDLRRGRVDVGIVHGPIPTEQGIDAEAVARVPFDHLAIPSTHRLARKRLVDASMLEGEAVLLVERRDAPTYHDATLAYCREHDVHPVWVTHPSTQVERMLDMVAVGTGIGWLNSWQAGTVRRAGVAIRRLEPVTRFDDLFVAWSAAAASDLVQTFVEDARSAAEAAVLRDHGGS
jgi:DNA-binding transcriptional LysR family regulator